MKLWLQDNDIEMYSTHNQEYVVAKRFQNLKKNKISKCMTSILKNVCIDKLADIANKYDKKIWHHQYEAC